MAVGTTAITCYQGEDVSWQFTYTDSNAPDITGWDIELVIKASAAAADPALIEASDVTITIDDATHFTAEFNVDLDPGSYVYSARRKDAGFDWQLAQGALTVVDSASID